MFSNKSNQEKKINYIDVDKDLHLYKENEEKKVKIEGQNIALNNPPKSVSELKTISVYQKIKAGFTSKLAEIGVLFLNKLENLGASYTQLMSNASTNNEIKEAQSTIEDLEKEKQTAINEAVVAHDEDIEDKKEEITELKGTKKNLRISLKGLKYYRLWPRYVIGSLAVALVVVGESLMNADVFEYAGFNATKSKIIGFTLSVVTFFLGIGLATILRKNWSKTTKFWTSVLTIILVCTVFLTLGKIRLSQMSAQADSEGMFGLSAFHFMVFNLAFFAAVFSIKYFIFPSPAMTKSNKEFNAFNDQLKIVEKQLEALKKAIANAHISRAAAKKAVSDSFIPKIKEVQDKVLNFLKEKKRITIAFNETLSSGQNFYTQINNDYKIVCASFFSAINLYRNDKISLPNPELEDLKNPFENYTPIETFQAEKNNDAEQTSTNP